MFFAEVRMYYRWKERIIWDILGALIMFVGFILVWRAIIAGGFQGIGDLTAENYITFILCGSLLWDIIYQAAGWQMALAIIRDKDMRTLPYVLLSPMNKIAYLYAKVGLGIVRFVINNTILILLASIFFDFSFKGSLMLTLFLFFLTFLAFSGIGLIISSLGAWREGIAQFAMVLTDILYLFSGVHYPIEVFPESMRSFVSALPTTQAINAVRAIGLHGAGIFEIMPQIIYLGIMALITPLLGYLAFRWVRNRAMLIGI